LGSNIKKQRRKLRMILSGAPVADPQKKLTQLINQGYPKKMVEEMLGIDQEKPEFTVGRAKEVYKDIMMKFKRDKKKDVERLGYDPTKNLSFFPSMMRNTSRRTP